MNAEKNWWYSQGGQKHGPFSAQELKALAIAGDIHPSDMLHKEGVPPILASSIKGLIPVVDLQTAFTAELDSQPPSALMRTTSGGMVRQSHRAKGR